MKMNSLLKVLLLISISPFAFAQSSENLNIENSPPQTLSRETEIWSRLERLRHHIQGRIAVASETAAREDLQRLSEALVRIADFRHLTGYTRLPNQNGVCRLAGTQTYTQDTYLECPHIIFADGYQANVNQGTILYFHADQITVEGHARIEGAGTRGTSGNEGASAVDWDTASWRDYVSANNDCDVGRSGANDRGQVGSDGTNGGDGAIILFSVEPHKLVQEQGISWNVMPGRGGAGGLGGRGANHFFRGPLFLVSPACVRGECAHHCPDAAQGRPGLRGRAGFSLSLISTDGHSDFRFFPVWVCAIGK